MEPSLDASLVKQSLNYHGQQLQKTWEAERGEDDLVKIGVGALDFAVYQSRHKHLTFQDRGKRLKLHHFIAKEANALFDASVLEETPSSSSLGADAVTPEDKLYALMPPFETFLNVDKAARLRHFFDNVKTGELIIGAVFNRTASGMMLKVLCTAGPTSRYVADINVKAFLPVTNIIPAVDKKNLSRTYLMNDTVCCEVIEVIPDTDKMVCGMKGVTRGPDDPPPKPPLGLLSTDDFPLIYKYVQTQLNTFHCNHIAFTLFYRNYCFAKHSVVAKCFFFICNIIVIGTTKSVVFPVYNGMNNYFKMLK